MSGFKATVIAALVIFLEQYEPVSGDDWFLHDKLLPLTVCGCRRVAAMSGLGLRVFTRSCPGQRALEANKDAHQRYSPGASGFDTYIEIASNLQPYLCRYHSVCNNKNINTDIHDCTSHFMLIKVTKCSYFFRERHPHCAIRTACMPSYVKVLEDTQAELTLCVSPPQPRMEKSPVHRWCSRGSHSLLQFWASDQSCGGCQASLQPQAVCVCVCFDVLCVSLSVFIFYVSDTVVILHVLYWQPVKFQDRACIATDTQHKCDLNETCGTVIVKSLPLAWLCLLYYIISLEEKIINSRSFFCFCMYAFIYLESQNTDSLFHRHYLH